MTMNHTHLPTHPNETICIVGMGCILPGANTIEQFWLNTLSAQSQIHNVPTKRWDPAIHFDANREAEDKTYSTLGAFVSDTIIQDQRVKLNLVGQTHHRLKIMTLGASSQALHTFNKKDLSNRKVDVVLGCMAVDESAHRYVLQAHAKQTLSALKEQQPEGWQSAVDEIEHYFAQNQTNGSTAEQTFLTTSITQSIKDNYALQGETALVDAACASSMAAIDNAIYRLRSGQCDLALSGGIEGDIGASSYVLFSKVGALAEQTCAPFDKKSQGLVQGEGAVVFVLQRLSDAWKENRPIYGIISGAGASSDGHSSSLFSPTVAGQMLAYERAYQQAGTQTPDYVECHGTGTQVGDTTELSSLSRFFPDTALSIGSVKALIGHTKGAAGAAGLLKSVLMITHRIIPPSPYFSDLIKLDNKVDTQGIHIHNSPQDFSEKKLIRIGISSFGFGNINYHLVLDEYRESSMKQAMQKVTAIPDYKKTSDAKDYIALLAEVDISDIDIDSYLKNAPVKLPPNSLEQTDKRQLQAVIAALESFKQAGISIAQLDKEKVCVFAASCLCLPASQQFSARVNYDNLISYLQKKQVSEHSIALLKQHKQGYARVTEDIGPGILNNVIAAKVCNTFDFKGKNLNIDADFLSLPVALDFAKAEILTRQANIVLVLNSQEQLKHDTGFVERQGFKAYLLSSTDYAQEQALPVKQQLQTIDYQEKAFA